MKVPDGIQPIDAFRVWIYTLEEWSARLDPLRGRLTPWSEWDGAGSRWVSASCPSPDPAPNHVPGQYCSCGFYAVKALFTLIRMIPPHIQAQVGPHVGPVLGRVELAGKIVEHEYGYRAERARIVELIPIRGTEPSVNRLGTLLRVAVGESVALPWSRVPPPPSSSSPRRRVADWVRQAAA
jgi:hypothetical protein